MILTVTAAIPIEIAATTNGAETIGAVDPATCALINSDIRSHPDTVPVSLRGAIDDLDDAGCRLVIEWETRTRIAGAPTAIAATSCKYVYKALHIYSGPIETYTARDDAYVCWNGTKAWQQDYHHCYVTAYPLGFGNSTWCGRLNNNTALVTLRNDFYIATHALPTWHRVGWMSYTVNKTGAVSGVSGSCCS